MRVILRINNSNFIKNPLKPLSAVSFSDDILHKSGQILDKKDVITVLNTYIKHFRNMSVHIVI